jgi:hypothetical protein
VGICAEANWPCRPTLKEDDAMSPKRRGMLPRPPKLDEMNHLQWAGFLVSQVILAVVGTCVALIVLTIIVGLADGH